MSRLFPALLIAAVLALPAVAQAQEDEDGGQIVVTGQRTAKEDVASFVDALVPVPPGKVQLSRFEWAICPRATGMLPEQAAAVEKRIRTVSRAAGIDVAGVKCTPNLLVVVTPDKLGFIAALEKRRPEYFGGMTKQQRKAITDPGNPVAAWHVDGVPVTAEGAEIPYDRGAGYYVNRTTRAPSRIGFAARPQFAAAIVVIDERALDGLTTTQLADYAAMRTLIASDPARLGGSKAPTILRVIDAPMGSEVPITLTGWDLGILKSFYSSNPTVSAAAQRSDVRRRLGNELDVK